MRFPGADANGHPYQRCLTIITITIHHEVDGRRSESWQFIQILIYLRMSKAHSVLNCIANGMQNVCQFFTSNAHNESGRGQSCSMYLTSGLAGWRKGGGSRSRSYNRNRGETANSNSRTVNCALFQLFRPSVRQRASNCGHPETTATSSQWTRSATTPSGTPLPHQCSVRFC